MIFLLLLSMVNAGLAVYNVRTEPVLAAMGAALAVGLGVAAIIEGMEALIYVVFDTSTPTDNDDYHPSDEVP